MSRKARRWLTIALALLILLAWCKKTPADERDRHPRPRRDRAVSRVLEPRRDQHDSPRHDNNQPSDDGRYDGYRSHRDRSWRWNRSNSRFPRHYGFRFFPYKTFHRNPFGPHSRLFEIGLSFYWPYVDAPQSGCNRYWVPTVQILRTDQRSNEYWDYSDWVYFRICFD